MSEKDPKEMLEEALALLEKAKKLAEVGDWSEAFVAISDARGKLVWAGDATEDRARKAL